jgi:DNA topoisomerase-1
MLPAVPNVEIRLGRFGTYVEGLHPKHGTPVKSTIPDTVAPADLTPETLAEFLGQQQQGPTSLGVDPVSGLNVYLRTGGFGPYVQLGEDPEEQGRGVKKPKRSSVPKDVPLNELGLEKALFLLSLPRLLGTHPTTNEEVRAGLGRFGPYVVHNGDFRSLKKEDSVWTITLERALALLAEEKKGRGRGADAGTAIGTHPSDGKPITLHNGKYGPYVKHDKVNATIPKDLQNTTITVEQAIALLDARAGAKKPAAKKRAAPRKKASASA